VIPFRRLTSLCRERYKNRSGGVSAPPIALSTDLGSHVTETNFFRGVICSAFGFRRRAGGRVRCHIALGAVAPITVREGAEGRARCC